MRALRRWVLLWACVSTGALGWGLSQALSPPRTQPAADSPGSSGRNWPIFTPAHRSALEAIKDFFNQRRLAIQPVAFTHNVHLANGMECTNCHPGVSQSPAAGIPNVTLCMTCHQAIARDRPEIKKVAAYMARGEDIPWERVYNYSPPAHVKFNHAAHTRAKVSCTSCHGDMTRQTTAQRVVDLTMGYCVKCHQQRGASTDCMACHY